MKQKALLRRIRRIIPLIVVGLVAYTDYSSCYVIAWKEVYHQHLAAAAVFWALLVVLQVIFLFYWVMIFIRGPGKIPLFLHFDLYGTKLEDSTPVPDVFVCDEHGFPFWCSKCQNLKPDRSFHLTDLDTCVPRFDHFCLWVGTAIGRENFLPFIKFLLFFGAYCILVVCFVAVYARSVLRQGGSILLHFAALFIINGFIAIFIVALLIETMKNTFSNSTTLESITKRQARSYERWARKRENSKQGYAWCGGRKPRVELGFVNLAHEGTRKVVSFRISDHPYCNGFRANFVNTCLKGNYNINLTAATPGRASLILACIVMLVPFTEFFVATETRTTGSSDFERYSDEMSPAFMRKMYGKIERDEFQYALYLSPSAHSNTPCP